MSANVRELERKPDPVVVELLELLLADAKAGKIVGVVALTNEGNGYRRWQGGEWAVRDVVYLVEAWKHRVLGEGCE